MEECFYIINIATTKFNFKVPTYRHVYFYLLIIHFIYVLRRIINVYRIIKYLFKYKISISM